MTTKKYVPRSFWSAHFIETRSLKLKTFFEVSLLRIKICPKVHIETRYSTWRSNIPLQHQTPEYTGSRNKPAYGIMSRHRSSSIVTSMSNEICSDWWGWWQKISHEYSYVWLKNLYPQCNMIVKYVKIRITLPDIPIIAVRGCPSAGRGRSVETSRPRSAHPQFRGGGSWWRRTAAASAWILAHRRYLHDLWPLVMTARCILSVEVIGVLAQQCQCFISAQVQKV